MTYKYTDTSWQGYLIRLVVLPAPGIRAFSDLQALYDFAVQLQEGQPDNVVVIDSPTDGQLLSSPGHVEIGGAFYQQVDLRQFRDSWREGYY